MKPTTLFPSVLALLLLTGCGSAPLYPDGDADPFTGDDDDSVTGEDSGEPTWQRVQELFAERCSRCHTSNVREELTDLDDYDDGYEMLVERLSHQLPSMPLVSPSAPEESYLVHKLRGTHLEVGGEDDAMPPGNRESLNEEEIQLVEEWILAGALKD